MLNNLGIAQTNFRVGIEQSDPVDDERSTPFETKLELHGQVLEMGVDNGDVLQQIYGHMYLAKDYAIELQYEEAIQHLLEAKALANKEGQTGWEGWVLHRKAVVSVRMGEMQQALEEYLAAYELCSESGDSLCMAESLEQVSAMYGQLDQFDKAEEYFLKALPLIEKYGGQEQLGAALNNFGISNSIHNSLEAALPYFERSIAIYHEIDKYKEEGKGWNNLADLYRRKGLFERSGEIYEHCLQFNAKYGIPENLLTNYSGLHQLHTDMEDYESANQYLVTYYEMRDSLIGLETERRIAELEVKYESQEKELELQESRVRLLGAQRALERSVASIVFLILLFAFGLWRWMANSRQAKAELQKNQEHLKDLTKLLLKKNEQLAQLESKTAMEEESGSAIQVESLDENIFDLRILTDSDWMAFKASFEKAFPAFIHKIRKSFPTLTDAEERLALLIKLNVTRKEAATILGISSDSVKKTRNRLRKRLELSEEDNLEAYINTMC